MAFSSCCFILFTKNNLTGMYIPILFIFTIINIFPSISNIKIKSFRLRVCAEGSDLLTSFIVAVSASAAFHIYSLMQIGNFTAIWWISAAISVLQLSIVFWNGIIRVYCTSVQLGIKHRIIGIVCGPFPILNLLALSKIIIITSREVRFEHSKSELNRLRHQQQICSTKYPLLLVHGVFFRDYKHISYWGRIPAELKQNGATIYYGNHQSALSVNDSGKEIAERIRAIVETTGCEKVNVIAHSKGGLDCRSAISCHGTDKFVASLTTISTPHRGCKFVDYLLNEIPTGIKNGIAKSYNSVLRKIGETPDFLTAVNDLTEARCKVLNEQMQNSEDIFYQSVGSKLNKAVSGKFPMNLSYHFAKHFGGENDGLVAENSFRFGSQYTYLTVKGNRGISHADIIDLNRENIPDFDVREFYVQLVANLKNIGL